MDNGGKRHNYTYSYLSVITAAVLACGTLNGCGASGASIFMKDGSIVNIGDTNPQVPEEDGTGSGTGEGDAAGLSGPGYTYEGAYDPSTDPYITGGGVSPFYNPGGTVSPANDPNDPNNTNGTNATGQNTSDLSGSNPSGTGGNVNNPNGSGNTSDSAPRTESNLGGTAVEIISNATGNIIDDATRKNSDVYVATTGSDEAGDGTYDNPFFTVQKGIDSVSPGHTVYLMSGVYRGANTLTLSGTEKDPVTIMAYPSQSGTVSLGTGERGAVFDINGHSYINISGIRIGNSYATWVYGVFMAEGVHDINITSCEFCNISCTAAPGQGGAYAVLAYGNGDTEDKAIKNVTVYNNTVHDMNTGFSEALAASGNVTDIKFTGNTVYQISNIGIDLYGGGGYSSSQQFDQPRNCEISGNTVYQCVSPFASCAGIYVTNSRDCVVKENFAYENAYGIEVAAENNHYLYPTTKISVSGNTVHDNHDGGITIGGVDTVTSGFVTESELVGNILYNNGMQVNDGANGEIHFEKCDGIAVTDNIVRNHDYSCPVIGGTKTSEYVKNVKFTNNLYAYDKPEKIGFKFQGNEYIGLENWNKFTGGSDINKTGEGDKTK